MGGIGVRRLVGGDHRPDEIGEGDVARGQVVERPEHEPLEPLCGRSQRLAAGRDLVHARGVVLLLERPVAVHEDGVEGTGQHLGEIVRFGSGYGVVACGRVEALGVERVAEVMRPPLRQGRAELLRQRREVVALLYRPARGLEDLVAQLGVLHRPHQGYQVGDRFVDGQGLRGDGVVEVGDDAVEDGVPGFVGDDVLGERCVDPLALMIEEEELEAA